MWHRNSGKREEEILQNQFTAYLSEAVLHRRSEYIRNVARGQEMEDLIEDILFKQEILGEDDMFSGLPVFMQLESTALLSALKEISEKERYVFLGRVLDGKSFESLAEGLGLGYKGVASIYYRTVQKIKRKMKEFGR